MTSPFIYDTGTVTLGHGSADIEGNGTAWVLAGVRGGVMTVEVAGGNPLLIDTVDDDTTATAATKWMGPSGTFPYAIALASADAAETVWASRHWSRVVGGALLSAIPFKASGTLAERDALNPPLANGEWFGLAETDTDEIVAQLKVPGGWRSYRVTGAAGAPAQADEIYAAAVHGSLAAPLIAGEPRGTALDLIGQSAMVRDVYGEVPNFAGRPDDPIAFERLTPGVYIDRNGILRTAAANEMRYDHGPETLAALGILNEPAGTNLAMYSENFSASWWAKQAANIASGATLSPRGDMTASKIIPNTTNTTHAIYRAGEVFEAGTSYAGSLFLKAGEFSKVRIRFGAGSSPFPSTAAYSADFDLVSGAWSNIGGALIATLAKRLPGGWWRLGIEALAAAAGTDRWLNVYIIDNAGNVSYAGDGVSGLYAWGAQHKVGRVSSYIRTDGAQATRAADRASVPLSILPFNPTEGTVLWEGTINPSGMFSDRLPVFSLSSDLARASLAVHCASNAIRVGSRDDSQTFETDIGAAVFGVPFRVAASYNGSTVRASMAGGVIGSASQSTHVPDSLRLGWSAFAGDGLASQRSNGHHRRAVYISRALADAELRAWAGGLS